MLVKDHNRRDDFIQENYVAQVINIVVELFFLKMRLLNAS